MVLWIPPAPFRFHLRSVTESYLALGGGPPCFPQGFPCPVVLWILPGFSRFRLQGFHPLWPAFPKPFGYRLKSLPQSATPARMRAGLGSFHFARRYSGNRCFFLFLRVLRCFSSPGSPPSPKLFAACHVLHRPSVPRHPPCALHA